MKYVIALIASLSALSPAFAGSSNVQALFALSNDSTAERAVSDAGLRDLDLVVAVGTFASDATLDQGVDAGVVQVTRDVQAGRILGVGSNTESPLK